MALSLDNRFAVLRPQEPAPGVQQGERESTVSLSSGISREGPTTTPLRTDILSAEPLSLSEKVKGIPLAPRSSTTTFSKGASTSRLARHTPANSAPLEHNQQPPVPVATTTSSTKRQVHPSPLVLQIDTQAARSLKLSSTSNLISSDSITAAPHARSISPDPAPSLPEPPIPPDPMSIPSLATLPKSPSPDFRYLTSPKFCEPINGQFAVPKPTSSDGFYNDGSLHHIVRTIRGKIFWMAAEIAATNERSALKPVGSVLIPGAATKFGEVKGRVDRTKLNRTSGEYVNSREDTEDESDEEEEEAEEWLGKDEGFVSTLSDLFPLIFPPLLEYQDHSEDHDDSHLVNNINKSENATQKRNID